MNTYGVEPATLYALSVHGELEREVSLYMRKIAKALDKGHVVVEVEAPFSRDNWYWWVPVFGWTYISLNAISATKDRLTELGYIVSKPYYVTVNGRQCNHFGLRIALPEKLVREKPTKQIAVGNNNVQAGGDVYVKVTSEGKVTYDPSQQKEDFLSEAMEELEKELSYDR